LPLQITYLSTTLAPYAQTTHPSERVRFARARLPPGGRSFLPPNYLQEAEVRVNHSEHSEPVRVLVNHLSASLLKDQREHDTLSARIHAPDQAEEGHE